MQAFRSFGFALWLAFALVAGQHAVLLHGLGHASEKLAGQQEPKPAPAKCGECFACAQLVGAGAATLPHVGACVGGDIYASVTPRLAATANAVPYLSRAPPSLS